MKNVKNKPDVSVIIPVYNVERYLEKCVNSVLTQTFNNIEIILVDDGSTDNGSTMCDNFKKSDKRIRVIHKKNGGLSSARNAGLDIADGEYVYFLDSDDFILPDTLNDMIKLISENDIVIANAEPFYEGKKEPELFKSMVDYFDICFPLRFFYGPDFIKFPAVAWNKLYKKSIIDKYNLRFDEGLIHEDESWAWYYGTKIKKGIYCPNRYYKYLIRSTSIIGMKKQENSDIVKIVYNVYKHLVEYNLYTKYKRLFNDWAVNILKSFFKKAYSNHNECLCDLCMQTAASIQVDLNKPQKWRKRLFSITKTCDEKYKLINIFGFSIKRKIV